MAIPVAPSNLYIASTGPLAHTVFWQNNDLYDSLEIYYHQNGGTYSKLADLAADTESYDDTSTSGVVTGYKARGYIAAKGYSNFSNAETVVHYVDSTTVSISVTPAQANTFDGGGGGPAHYEDVIVVNIGVGVEGGDIGTGGDFDDTSTNNIGITTLVMDSQTLKTDYKYYLGTSNGQVNEYDKDYLSDNGFSIDSYWRSKAIASFDVFPSLYSNWMTLYQASIRYVDLIANTPIILSVSTDGGIHWESSTTREVGIGDGMVKEEYFYFIKTGAIFEFKIESPSPNKKFQIIGFVGFFVPRSQTFNVH